MGRYTYDAVNDLYSIDETHRKYWGFDSNMKLKFSDLICSVIDKQQFIEETLGHDKTHMHTSDIQITNGNIVRESLIYNSHPEDYEGRSLLSIYGVTAIILLVA